MACASMNTPLPTFPLRCSYTDIRISTPKAWAAAMHGVDVTAGDSRRVLEFWLDSREAPSGARIQSLANMLYRAKSTPSLPCLDKVKSMMEFSLPDGELKLDGLNSSSVLDRARGFLASGESMDYETIVCNLATADAYARGCTNAIPRESILAAWAVYLDVLENRKRLAESYDAAPMTYESQITGYILQYIGSRNGKARKSHVLRMLNTKGPSYVRAFEALVDSGLIVCERATDGKSTTVRRATDAEIEAADEKKEAQRRDKIFAEERANRDKVERGGSDFGPYADCAPDEKRARVLAYIEKFKLDHPLCLGTRNNGLWDLRVLLQCKNGMWDAIAQEAFKETAQATGLPDEEIKLLMRERHDGTTGTQKTVRR